MDVKVPLDSERLRLNSVIYPHRSKNLQIRLRVDLGTPHDGPLERAIGFVAPAVVHDAAASKPEPPVQPQIATRSADRQADDSLPVSVPALPRPNFDAETVKDRPS